MVDYFPPDEVFFDGDIEECPICGAEMYWEDCGVCGGDGELECYESDPLYYDEDDVEPCYQCGGSGGWATCSNYKNHPQKEKAT